MAITQANRLMSISTPLGEDFLLINKLRAIEGISTLFEYEVELLHEENEAGTEPTVVDVQQILGKAVSVTVIERDKVTRNFSGIVADFSQGNRDIRFSYYYAKIVPHVWLLTQITQTRIFQHISVPDILKKVFEGFNVKWEISGDFKPRNYCVQYRETDFAFGSRLMEEEGIYYYFSHEGGTNQMIVANTPQSHRDCPTKSSIPFVTELTKDEEFISLINEWLTDYHLQTGKITLWDYHFQLPNNKLDAQQPSRFDVGGNQELEVYEFRAGYARKYDGIDKTGGERPSDLQNIFNEKQRDAEIVMQTLDSQYKTGTGISTCPSMTAGYRFKMILHPYAALNTQYVLTHISHDCEQSPSYVSEFLNQQAYKNQFTCIAHGAGMAPFRPVAKTPKPIMRGNQTAVVVGPAGEEIFTDKYGRVKVQFQWDREGKLDANSSCWIRVVQNWAANKWGTMFIPRIGMEVVVSFLEGDPDQPTITGCVYNPEAMPPYKLPDEKTKSTIKSNSSLGGNGFNEFRFEDKKGSEQIFIHAEKNQDIRVKNDCLETIKHDRHLIVENEQFEKVKKDKHLQVGGDHNEKVGGTMSLKVGSDLQEKVGSNYALDAGSAVHIKAGMTAVIEAGTSLTLKVGGNFININPGGIFIKGTMVMLNSGGAAGSGAGSSPEAPKDPKEADKADPGQKIKPKTPPPPLKPKKISPMAAAMQSAASKGTPFCT
jgi:type VI secretion system secreted protein VgrG